MKGKCNRQKEQSTCVGSKGDPRGSRYTCDSSLRQQQPSQHSFIGKGYRCLVASCHTCTHISCPNLLCREQPQSESISTLGLSTKISQLVLYPLFCLLTPKGP